MIKKTKLCAIAVAVSAIAGTASAQNVTLFGRIDAGIQYTSKHSGANDEGHLFEVNNGGILPSIWGLKGSEDLGGGLKAVFNLEADFDSSTGGHRALGNISQPVFSRQANVGLSSDWGTVLIGRQYSPALLAELGTDPRGYKESFSSLLSYAANQLPAGNDLTTPGSKNGAAIFTSNLVSYTGKFGPIGVGAGFGLGEGNNGLGDGRTYSLGLTYTGPVVVSGSFQKVEGAPDAETKRYALGVAVPIGDVFTVKALWARAEGDDLTGDQIFKTDNVGVGVDVKWGGASTATLAYYYGKDKDNNDDKTKSLVLSNDYAMSKRTTLYAQYVYVDADDEATARTQITLGSTPSGEKSHIFGVGIKHDF